MKLAHASLPAHWQRRLRLGAISFVTFLVIFGLVGYLWLPGFAKTKLETLLTEKLHRPVTVEKISISPYTLSATVEGFKAGDVLAFKSLYINISSATLLQRLPVISEVKLVQPEVHLVRESANRLNISDLLDEWLNKPKNDDPTPEFSISNIQLEGGLLAWEDKVAGGKQTVSDISLGIPFVANIPSKVDVFVEPKFAARLNGAPLAVDGKLRPFAQGHDAQVNLDLDDLDLTPLMAYAKLPVKLQSLKLDTKLEFHFEKPGSGDPALKVAGDLSLKDLNLSLLSDHARTKFTALTLKHIAVDVFKQQASIGEILLSRPDIALLRSGPGSLDFASLGKPATTTKSATNTSTKAPPAAPGKSWHWAVDRIAIADGQLRFEDSSVPKALPLTIGGMTVEVGAVAANKPDPIPLSVKAAINQRGSLAIDGKASLKGDADVKIDLRQLELVALQGWAAEHLNAILTKGDISFQGNAQWQDGVGNVTGDLTLGDFNILDKLNADDLLRWKSLKFSGLKVKTPTAARPLDVDVGDINLKDVFAKVLINAQGQLNLKDIVKHDTNPTNTPATSAASAASASPASPTSPTAPLASATPGTAPAKAGPAPNIRVGKITVSGGATNFTDRFIKPNYSARITDLRGSIGALKAGTLSPVDFHGKVERTAPLDISGKIDPLSPLLSLELRASARGVDLPPLTAYAARYVGYGIEKGKLSMDVNYHVNKGELSADNHIFLDQLTFTENKVEEKSALNLPVHLAVALLRNGRGEIDINLPISGSLNDPQFSVGGIILKVIGNLLVKAVTSPFALLGSLFGGGEDLSQITFAPGLDRIAPEMEGKLQSIAKAMLDRPALKLEITGGADPAVDRDGLRRALIDRKMRSLKLADQAGKGKAGGKLGDVQIGKDEYASYLERVYKAEDFKGKPRNLVGLQKTLPPAEMESLLMANLPASDTDLQALAEDRSQQVQSWLVEKGGVPQERMFLRTAKLEDNKEKPEGRVVFSLR